MTSTLHIAGRKIGAPYPCFIIAEAGVNHNGDPELAHRLLEVAAEAGVDAIKFQTFSPEKLASAQAPKAEYQLATTSSGESQLDMLRRLTLHSDQYPKLMDEARDRGLLFLSTPFDESSADFLESLGLPTFKIPSGEITNFPLLAHVARKGKPMLISTGMCTLAEVREALRVVADNGDPPIALFHCVSCYPALPADCNLRAMDSLAAEFHVPVGWSDHTLGTAISIAAVARGAALVEKHFTLDRTLPGPDHRMSLEPAELMAMVQDLRATEQALGDGVKRPSNAEMGVAAVARKSLHFARNLPAGSVLGADDVVARRPGAGISPSRLSYVIGRKLAMPVCAGELVRDSHLA